MLRVLHLTHHLPWPTYSGGRLREAEIIRRLARWFDIEVVAVTKTPEVDRGALRMVPGSGVSARVFAAVTSGHGFRGPLARRHQSDEARRFLEDRLRRSHYDVVHVEGHFLLPLLPDEQRRRVVLVEHNIESSLFVQRAELANSAVERWRLRVEAALTAKAERRAWRTVQSTIAVTEEDATVIRLAVPGASVQVVKNGADHMDDPSEPGTWSLVPKPLELLMVGNLAYQPNQDAAEQLLKDILPRVRSECPDTTLAIVGDGPPSWLVEAAVNDCRLIVSGRVPDVVPWLDAAKVVVCPLRVGGGIKVKVMEALARGRAVVTTPIGAQGLRELPSGH